MHPQRLKRIDSSIFIRPIDTTEIRNVVQAMKGKAGGVDNINTTVLKNIINYIDQPLQ